jgi:hypothetical protein
LWGKLVAGWIFFIIKPKHRQQVQDKKTRSSTLVGKSLEIIHVLQGSLMACTAQQRNLKLVSAKVSAKEPTETPKAKLSIVHIIWLIPLNIVQSRLLPLPFTPSHNSKSCHYLFDHHHHI